MMIKRIIGLFCALFCMLSTGVLVAQNLYQEKRSVIYQAKSQPEVLQPGKGITIPIDWVADGSVRRRLRVTGGVQMPAPFTHRGEEMFRRAEYYVDDYLDSVHVMNDRYALLFKGHGEPFERYAYYRITDEAVLRAGKVRVRIPVVRKTNLSVSKDGTFGLRMELYKQKPGRAAGDIYDKPDSVIYIPVAAGQGKKQKVEQEIVFPEHLACVLLCVGGYSFDGECSLEAPLLLPKGGKEWHVPFTKFEKRTNQTDYWVGCNLSSRSWPEWKLDLNGQPIFQGQIFDRASNVADFYIPLPDSVAMKGALTLSLQKVPYAASFPYQIRTIEVIEETARDYEVVSVPRYVTKGQTFGVLIETNRPGVTLRISAPEGLSPAEQKMAFAEKGLHVVRLIANRCGVNVPLEVTDGQRKAAFQIAQVVERTPGVFLSSGDDIYIPKDRHSYDYYLKWYLSQRVGNWMQFRPSYQWSGSRIIDETFTEAYLPLLVELNMPYAWQVEGRTLAGNRLNPSNTALWSDCYHGKQAHENDGGYYYWKHFTYQGLYSDLAARNRPLGGIFAKHRPIVGDSGIYIHYDPYAVKDMAHGARLFVSNLRSSKGESSRHTGPSTLFRYFYQAGYNWVGAEQMYGPEETILSTLRGASKAYNRPVYGSLHAMQWGGGPYRDPKHAERFYMSLATAYMHGSSEINTEEALWTDEYMNDRYSESGKQHMDAQHKMLDFIETHTRRGTFYDRIAVLQGRNDPWESLGRGSLWSQNGQKWQFNKACESFDLIRLFYPNNEMDWCGPDNWFTPTPYGPIDIVPVEAPQDVLDQYKFLFFLGWNSYDAGDFERLRDYVHQGGTLLLTAAHLNSELQPDQPVAWPVADEPVRELLGADYRSYTKPMERIYGSGKVIYFPEGTYPADAALKESYTSFILQQAQQITAEERKEGWIIPQGAVSFTVWEDGGRRTFYLMNTDWREGKEEQAYQFALGGHLFDLTISSYRLGTIHSAEGLAVLPSENTTDVLSIVPTGQGWTVRVQTTGKEQLRLLFGDSGATETRAITEAGIHEFEIKKRNPL